MTPTNIDQACTLTDTYLQELINLVTQQNQVLQGIYVVLLWTIGICGALFVLLLLYKFIRLFY